VKSVIDAGGRRTHEAKTIKVTKVYQNSCALLYTSAWRLLGRSMFKRRPLRNIWHETYFRPKTFHCAWWNGTSGKACCDTIRFVNRFKVDSWVYVVLCAIITSNKFLLLFRWSLFHDKFVKYIHSWHTYIMTVYKCYG